MSSSDGAGEAFRRRAGADGSTKEPASSDQVYHCDYEALRVKTQPSFFRRWNNVFAGFLWSLLHFYLTYNLILQLAATDGKLAFLRQRLFLMADLALFWGLLASAVYGVFLFDKCVRFHVANFDAFPKMYSDHALQAALMHGDLKNHRFAKQLYGAIFLAPMRLLACILFFAISILLIGLPLTIFGGCCRYITRQYVATMFYYVTLFGFWGIGISELKTVYADGVVRDKPINVISNHIGIMDVLYMLHSGSFSFVCKKALEPTFIIGQFIRLLNCITVDRDSAPNRKDAYRAIVDRMKSINEGHERVSLVVYPEGTTSRGNILLPFKNGAFGAMVPLQPLLMVLEYSYINASFDAFPWKWWAVLSCCSPASLRLIAYWLPAIQPPAAEDSASKGEHERVREYTAISSHVMREAIIKLNPNVDMGHLQKPHVVVLPAWRNKLLARLYGPVMQRYYKISDEEMRKTEEVVFH